MAFMHRVQSQNGMTIVEALIVTGIIALLASIAGMMVSRFNVSRSINDIARNISSTLQMAKLKSGRDGVEYRAVFSSCNNIDDTDPDCKFCTDYTDYQPDDEWLTITLERGNSNTGSDKWCIMSSQRKKMTANFNLDITDLAETEPYRCGFGPKGFMVDEMGLPVMNDARVSLLVTPSSTSRVNTCGIVELSPPLGGIDVIRGNWDGTNCDPIREP